MARNLACDNEDGTRPPCGGDGRGGCVACDDGKGNYKPKRCDCGSMFPDRIHLPRCSTNSGETK